MVRTTTISPWVEIGLRFIGMWPNSAYPDLYWVSYIIFTVVLQYFQYAYVIVHFDAHNLPLLMDCLGLSIATTLSVLKLCALRWNRRIFHYILSTMNKDWDECVIRDSSRSIMMIVANQSRWCSYILIGVHSMVGISYTIGTYAFHALSTDVRQLPLRMEFSFDPTISPFFECILAAQLFYAVTIASIIGMINALLVCLVLHVGSQIDVMKQDIIQMPTNRDPYELLAIVREFVFRHRKIISMSNNIESVFTIIAFMQLLWNSFIICSLGLMIVMSISSNKGISVLIRCTVFYVAKTIEVFVFCYAGEFLSEKNNSISDAIYESLWYNMLPSTSRSLLFIIMRSQKRLTITAGGVIDLTLDRFINVMKTSASYISVLLAMY